MTRKDEMLAAAAAYNAAAAAHKAARGARRAALAIEVETRLREMRDAQRAYLAERRAANAGMTYAAAQAQLNELF